MTFCFVYEVALGYQKMQGLLNNCAPRFFSKKKGSHFFGSLSLFFVLSILSFFPVVARFGLPLPDCGLCWVAKISCSLS